MPIDDFIIHIYVLVDDFLKADSSSLRKSGPKPHLTDAEVMTMEVVGEHLGLGSDKRIFDYFSHHWAEWFPALKCRTTFVRQCANLWKVKEHLQQSLIKTLASNCDLFLFDGFPIPTCHKKRVHQRNPFKGIGAFGYCAAKDEKYFGFKGHLLTDQYGTIMHFSLTPANVDERDVLPEVTEKSQGMVIADKGLIRPELSELLLQRGLNLQTPLRENMKDKRPPHFVTHIISLRRTIETVIAQLVDRFHIQSIRAKDLWHLASKIGRKILAHTIGCFMAKSLKFDQILS